MTYPVLNSPWRCSWQKPFRSRKPPIYQYFCVPGFEATISLNKLEVEIFQREKKLADRARDLEPEEHYIIGGILLEAKTTVDPPV